jgi:membrane protein required for colicin V production
MNGLDLFILAVLAGGLVIGFRSGLIKQALSLVGLVVAFLLALRLMEGVGEMAAHSLGISPDIAPLVGFALVFGGVQLTVFALVRLLEAVVGALKLSAVNRVLGGAVGGLKATIVLSVVFLLLGYLAVPSEATQRSSAFYEPVSVVLPATWETVRVYFPQVQGLSERFGDEVEQRLPDATPAAPVNE